MKNKEEHKTSFVQERRKAPRKKNSFILDYKNKDALKGSQAEFNYKRAYTIDTSPEGIAIFSRYAETTFSHLLINFPHVDTQPLIAEGEVRYCLPASKQGFKIGIQFDYNFDDCVQKIYKKTNPTTILEIDLKKDDKEFLESICQADPQAAIIGICNFFKDLNIVIDKKINNEKELVHFFKDQINKAS